VYHQIFQEEKGDRACRMTCGGKSQWSGRQLRQLLEGYQSLLKKCAVAVSGDAPKRTGAANSKATSVPSARRALNQA
jgi:hypothetical protein